MLLAALLFLAPVPALAQDTPRPTVLVDRVSFYLAVVDEVLEQGVREVPGTDTSFPYQRVVVRVLDGPQTGKVLTLDNEFVQLAEGGQFYLRHTIDGATGAETYAVSDPYRLGTLWLLLGIFLVCLFAFGGWQGLRGLLALAASFVAIGYLLLPGILAGYPPLLVATAVAGVIVVAGSYITHGFNRTTSAAVLGMLATIVATGLLALFAVDAAQLTGFAQEDAVYLNFNTQGSIDFVGLLLAGLVVGLLGVLYDAAIGQAVAVDELVRAAAHYSRKEVFARALRIGREHIGALVNTLAIAYAGASLPLLLLLTHSSTEHPVILINQEILATEIIRTLVGSTGLVLAVPLTTAIAVYMLYGRPSVGAHQGHSHHH